MRSPSTAPSPARVGIVLPRLSTTEILCLSALALSTRPLGVSEWAAWLKKLRLRTVVRKKDGERGPRANGTKRDRAKPQGRLLSAVELQALLARKAPCSLLEEVASGEGSVGGQPIRVTLVACIDEAVEALLSDPRARPVLDAGRAMFAEVDAQFAGDRWRFTRDDDAQQPLACARAALFSGDTALCERAVARALQVLNESAYRYDHVDTRSFPPLLLPPSSSATTVARLPQSLWEPYATDLVDRCIEEAIVPPEAVLCMIAESELPSLRALRPMVVSLRALGPACVEGAACLGDDRCPAADQARALLRLQAGDVQAARSLTLTALENSRGQAGRKQPFLDSPLAPLLTLVLATGDDTCRQAAALQVKRAARRRETRIAHEPVAQLLSHVHPRHADCEPSDDWQWQLLQLAVSTYLGEPTTTYGLPVDATDWATNQIDEARWQAERALAGGADWLAEELVAFADAIANTKVEPRTGTSTQTPNAAAQTQKTSRASKNSKNSKTTAAKTDPTTSGVLASLMKPIPPWQRGLDRLQEIVSGHSPAQQPICDTHDTDQPRQRLVFAIRSRREAEDPLADAIIDVDAPEFPELVALLVTDDNGGRPPRQVSEENIEDYRRDLRGARLSSLALPRERLASLHPYTFAADNAGDNNLLPVTIEARVQTLKGQSYSPGRKLSARKLSETASTLDYLTEADVRVIDAIETQSRWNYMPSHTFGHRSLRRLVGHPYVFWADKLDQPAIAIVESSFSLRVVENRQGLRMRLDPRPNGRGMALFENAKGQLALCELDARQLQVQEALQDAVPVPRSARTVLDATLSRLSGLFPIHTDRSVVTDGEAVTVQPDSRPVVLLKRLDPGLDVRVVAMPLGPQGPSLAFGRGLPTVAYLVDGIQTQCTRDLNQEKAALNTAAAMAPELDAAAHSGPLRLDNFEACLKFLGALDQLGDQVSLQWAHGQSPIAVTRQANSEHLNLRLSERQDWLELNGQLVVDEQLVVDLGQLLAAQQQPGGFFPLGDDRYMPLSPQLQQQLAALRSAAAGRRGKQEAGKKAPFRLPPVALGFVSPWLKELHSDQIQLNGRASQRLRTIEAAMTATPEPPSTFQAELRAYQVDGYRFLSRLAMIEAGAVLADDMGLGKTLMTLALLVERASRGPGLVVAPVSVKRNWCDEARRFAPTLGMRILERGDAAEVASAEPFEVLVCSYAMMTRQVDDLEQVRWSTLVLDEAQAIKNSTTQRSKAARRLMADARVALTGTPVENNLGDLFGLMSFLNPGLLGTARQFEERFGKPIQRNGDTAASEALRTLIAPFTLRRRKSAVLRELPQRTEVLVEVEPGEEERAFVEALRREALQRLKRRSQNEGAICILAEITRLRRAACHPCLVDAQNGAAVGSAKLDRLVTLLHELKAGGHKALVFSQFVDFLALARVRLDQVAIEYQYLDGSTPEKKRNAAVAAFQSGEGDAFLISLKAGGFGLNLTAADYVIHLDPWWNPAVEDQASDRAHRIGQLRPVCIYKLVNVGSIEQNVLALHAAKRELADELLQESDVDTRLDTRVLMSLIEGT